MWTLRDDPTVRTASPAALRAGLRAVARRVADRVRPADAPRHRVRPSGGGGLTACYVERDILLDGPPASASRPHPVVPGPDQARGAAALCGETRRAPRRSGPRRGANLRRRPQERERQAVPALRGPAGGPGLGRGDAVVRRRALAAAPGAEPGRARTRPRLVSAITAARFGAMLDALRDRQPSRAIETATGSTGARVLTREAGER